MNWLILLLLILNTTLLLVMASVMFLDWLYYRRMDRLVMSEEWLQRQHRSR